MEDRLRTLYNIFINTVMRRLIELLEEKNDVKTADRVIQIDRELRAICTQQETS